jgi:hypothetical protein
MSVQSILDEHNARVDRLLSRYCQMTEQVFIEGSRGVPLREYLAYLADGWGEGLVRALCASDLSQVLRSLHRAMLCEREAEWVDRTGERDVVVSVSGLHRWHRGFVPHSEWVSEAGSARALAELAAEVREHFFGTWELVIEMAPAQAQEIESYNFYRPLSSLPATWRWDEPEQIVEFGVMQDSVVLAAAAHMPERYLYAYLREGERRSMLARRPAQAPKGLHVRRARGLQDALVRYFGFAPFDRSAAAALYLGRAGERAYREPC